MFESAMVGQRCSAVSILKLVGFLKASCRGAGGLQSELRTSLLQSGMAGRRCSAVRTANIKFSERDGGARAFKETEEVHFPTFQ